jgi:hypothetical protein
VNNNLLVYTIFIGDEENCIVGVGKDFSAYLEFLTGACKAII